MSTAQFRSARRQILDDLLRLAQAVAAGSISRDEYQAQHRLLSLLLVEINQAELSQRSRYFLEAA